MKTGSNMPTSESVFARWLDPTKEIPEVDPANTLLEWLTYRWPEATITLRDVCRCGPGFLRNDRESAFGLTEILVQQGRLIPIAALRRDMRAFRIIKEPVRK
jgi:hypothetical protein